MGKRFILLTEYNEIELKEIIESAVQGILEKVIADFNKKPLYTPPDFLNNKFLSRKEVCGILKISTVSLAKIQKEGKIKATIIGSSYRYSRKNIEEYINDKTISLSK